MIALFLLLVLAFLVALVLFVYCLPYMITLAAIIFCIWLIVKIVQKMFF